MTESFEERSASTSGLTDALLDRHLIGVAVGMVAVQRQQSPQTALGTLVRIAHRTDRSVVEVARHLVARHSHSGRVPLGPQPTEHWDVDPGGLSATAGHR